eukprot:4897365-Pleurochrysis_carterae.AAC.1
MHCEPIPPYKHEKEVAVLVACTHYIELCLDILIRRLKPVPNRLMIMQLVRMRRCVVRAFKKCAASDRSQRV